MTDWLEETPPVTFNRYSFDDITTQSLLTLSKMKMTRRASGLSVTTSAQAQNVIQMISTELPILLKIGNSKEILVLIVHLWSLWIPWEACGLIYMKAGWLKAGVKTFRSKIQIYVIMELQTKLNLSVSKTKHTTLKEVQSIMHPSPEPQQSIRFDKNSLFQNYHLQHGAFHVTLADVYFFCIKCKLVTSGYHMIW